jgi:tRNA pseudouridine38-40 synthase
VVAYDGNQFRGFQSQPGGGTVQDALEEALARLVGTRVCVYPAGRTDAGVSARSQVCLKTSQLGLHAWGA